MNVDRVWYELPTPVQLALLSTLLPGALLHELVHFWTFRGAADECWLDWDTLTTHAVVPLDVPKSRRVVPQIAPTLLGCLLLPLIVIAAPMDVPAPILFWAGANFVIFALPSPGDILGALRALREQGRADGARTASGG